MASREQRRAQLVPALAKITRRPDFRASLSRAVGSDGGLTIIPVLPDDKMGYVFDRLREADDRGVVAMHVGKEWRVAITWPTTPARATVARGRGRQHRGRPRRERGCDVLRLPRPEPDTRHG